MTRGEWIPDEKLRALCVAGLTYEEIALVNEHATGWKPNKGTVKRHVEKLGVPSRYTSHKELIPWKIKPEHTQSRLRYMLQSESRRRQGMVLSRTDKAQIAVLKDLLYGRGRDLVIGYDDRLGFYLTDKLPTDTDIIRSPNHTRKETE